MQREQSTIESPRQRPLTTATLRRLARDVQKVVDRDYCDADLTVDEVGRLVGASRRQIQRALVACGDADCGVMIRKKALGARALAACGGMACRRIGARKRIQESFELHSSVQIRVRRQAI